MVVFSHFIDSILLLGAGIVVAAGLVVMVRERKLRGVKIVDGPILSGQE